MYSKDTSLYVPAGQSSHIDILDLFPDVPFWHGLHKLVEFFDYVPILQSMQSSNTRSWPASHPVYDSDIYDPFFDTLHQLLNVSSTTKVFETKQ